MLYLTPNRYRTMGTGVDLSEKSDADLRVILTQAAILTNQAVNAPEGYSFLGGTVTDEEHLWNVGNAYQPASGRIWPYFRPVREVSSMRINVTKQQYIEFTDAQLFTQLALGYVEPIAAPNTTALFTSVPPWLLSSPVAYVSYSYGWQFDVVDEVLATTSGELQAANQFWYTDEEVELKKNGVAVAEADFEIDYTEGTVTPDASWTDDDEFTVSYSHKLPPGVAVAQWFMASDIIGGQNIVAAGLLGLSGIKVEEVELRQSSKVNFYTTPISPAAQTYLAPYRAMFVSMR